MPQVNCIDLFCGAGGMTHGFMLEGVPVALGVDFDGMCKHAYEHNNAPAKFMQADIAGLSGADLVPWLAPQDNVTVLIACPPCQPFSNMTSRYDDHANRKDLVRTAARLAVELEQQLGSMDIFVMENVANVREDQRFKDLVQDLQALGMHVWHDVVQCADYGVPQTRRRTVLLASRLGPLSLTGQKVPHVTVGATIGKLPSLAHGQTDKRDRYHKARGLTDLNLRRIQASRPGGTWKDWPPELLPAKQLKQSGQSYVSVCGRMSMDKVGPTITTEFYNYGSGRFGHPVQDRALSIREGAMMQGFSRNYEFLPPTEAVTAKHVGRMIGNAVPVQLARAIARSIKAHIAEVL